MTMQPTRPSLLLALFALMMTFGWSVIRLWPRLFGQNPSVPWLAALTMVALCGTVLGWALIARTRLQPPPGKPRWHPLTAARTVAFAMAASRVGALAAGFYAGFLVASLPSWSTPAGQQRVVVSLVIVLSSLATAVLAVWLERMCQLPKPPAAAPSGGQTV
jgi:fructose-specific phosphotransferase system IIC component